jgi:predicted transcriptional regulator
MPIDDAAAAEYYEDPSHLVAKGPGRRRTRPGLSVHVPIRFRPETIAKVKILADRAGQTVSSWIRSVIENEVRRQLPDASTQSEGKAQASVSWRSDDDSVSFEVRSFGASADQRQPLCAS